MKAPEFVRRVRKFGRKNGIPVRYDPRRGVGSHGKLYVGDRATTIIDLRHEIGPKLLNKMCRQLGVDWKDI